MCTGAERQEERSDILRWKPGEGLDVTALEAERLTPSPPMSLDRAGSNPLETSRSKRPCPLGAVPPDARTRRTPLGQRALLAAATLLWLAAPAWAQITVPANWPLKPAAVGLGDTFRLLIVTSARRDGQPLEVQTYNQWVAAQVRSKGHSAIVPFAGQFRALAGGFDEGIQFISARTNTATTGTGVPIYWLNGPRVADDYNDFYDGSWDSDNGYTEAGVASSGGGVYTGTESNGDAPNNALHRLGWVHPKLGSVGPGRKARIDIGVGAANNGIHYPFFGLSPLFQVGTPVPPRPVLSESSLHVEVGDRPEYTVRLSRAPFETTRLVIQRIEHDENPLPTHTPVVYTPQYLTFTTTDWNTPQTVELKINNPLVQRPDGTVEIQDKAQVRLDHVIYHGESGEAEHLDIHITKRWKCPQDLPGGAFWKACLTLGAGPGGLLGYSGATGSLSSNEFTYDGTTYAVDGLYLQGGNWHLSFDRAPTHASKWQFVDVVTEESATSINRVTSWTDLTQQHYDAATHSYILPHQRPDYWVDGAKVSVALVGETDGGGTGGQRAAPGPPATFEAAAGDGEVTLSWTAPEEGADAVTGWQVRHGETNVNSGATDWGEWTDVAGSSRTTTTHTVTGLANGTSYGFQVRAMAGDAAGQESVTHRDITESCGSGA